MSRRTLSHLADAGARQDAKTHCNQCHARIQMVLVDGRLTAVETEVMSFAPATSTGGTRPVSELSYGRRLHASVCDSYKLAREREKHRRELEAYNRRQARKGGL